MPQATYLFAKAMLAEAPLADLCCHDGPAIDARPRSYPMTEADYLIPMHIIVANRVAQDVNVIHP